MNLRPAARALCLFAFGVLALSACSTPKGQTRPDSKLPEFAAPKGRVVDQENVDLSDVISYRTLERADFKAEHAPPEFGEVADRLGAATCGYLITTPDTQGWIEPWRSHGGKIVYRVTPRHLGFFAQMNRRCSWWNPKDIGLPQAYILEHEQIHFALFELEARRLNASKQEIEARLGVTAARSEAAAREAFQRQLVEQIQARMQDILARSVAFDEDTSMGHNPTQQKRWWELVQSELAATSD